MKKHLLALLFYVGFISMTNAQIIQNTLDADGNRHIICENENVRSFTDKIVTYVHLSYLNGQYRLFFTFDALAPISINEGGRVLIKTENGKTLSFNIAASDSDNIGTLISTSFGIISQYSITTHVNLSKEDIINLSSGVTKFRIEMSNIELPNGYFDKEFKSDKIGEKVLTDYRAIGKALKETKSFEDGF